MPKLTDGGTLSSTIQRVEILITKTGKCYNVSAEERLFCCHVTPSPTPGMGWGGGVGLQEDGGVDGTARGATLTMWLIKDIFCETQ